MNEHTPGEMTVEYGAAYIGNVRVLLADRDDDRTSPAERDANIRRAAACWNACEGIETEFLEGMSVGGVVAFRNNVEAILANRLADIKRLEARLVLADHAVAVAREYRLSVDELVLKLSALRAT